MDNKRREAYIKLINQLLTSPNGEEAKILQTNQELVDEGLLEIMEHRIRGDKAQNIEAAIAAYQQALLVYTQTDFPMDWAATQNLSLIHI